LCGEKVSSMAAFFSVFLETRVFLNFYEF